MEERMNFYGTTQLNVVNNSGHSGKWKPPGSRTLQVSPTAAGHLQE